jgi:hypothetical protein
MYQRVSSLLRLITMGLVILAAIGFSPASTSLIVGSCLLVSRALAQSRCPADRQPERGRNDPDRTAATCRYPDLGVPTFSWMRSARRLRGQHQRRWRLTWTLIEQNAHRPQRAPVTVA